MLGYVTKLSGKDGKTAEFVDLGDDSFSGQYCFEAESQRTLRVVVLPRQTSYPSRLALAGLHISKDSTA